MWYRCAKDAYELHISLWHSNLIWIVTYSWFMTWLCGFGRALLEETLITRKLQSVYLDLFFNILLFHVAYILFCCFFFSLLCLVGLLLQYVSLFQSRDLQLTMACRSCVIYVREDNGSNVYTMITRLIWTSLSAVREKPLILITY